MKEKTKLYQITLYDENTCPIGDGVARFFTYDIDDFRKRWVGTGRADEESVDRFDRSLRGEIVSDYYVNSEEYNIVKEDETASIFDKQEHIVENVEFEATNAYFFTERYRVKKWNIEFLWIRFKNRFYRIASYKAEDVKMLDIFLDWKKACCWGNPVLEQTRDGNDINTICYVVSKAFQSEEECVNDAKNFRIDEKVMDVLFANVIGEAG